MSISNKVFKNIINSIIISCFLLTINVDAQESGFNLDINVGTSPTSPLKEFHTSLKEQVNFDNFKTTDNFYINYGFTVGFTDAKLHSTIFYTNKVSGAKSSVADFSGYIRLTNELKGHTFGYKYYLPIQSNPNGNLLAQFKALATFSSFNITSNTKVLGTTQSESLDFKSTDLGVGAGILYEYPIGFLVLRAYLDLDIYYGGKLKLKENNPDGGFLLDENGNKLTTGWTGLTFGLGITVPFNSSK